MAGTSMGAVIDWLLAELPAPAAAAVPDAVIADGWGEVASQSYIVIGRENDSNGAVLDGDDNAIVLGAQSIEEDYSLNIWIYVERPGPGMKTARDAALALFDVVAALVASDRTLGGALKRGRYAEIQKIAMSADPMTDQNGSNLRVYAISFVLHCRNLYYPGSTP